MSRNFILPHSDLARITTLRIMTRASMSAVMLEALKHYENFAYQARDGVELVSIRPDGSIRLFDHASLEEPADDHTISLRLAFRNGLEQRFDELRRASGAHSDSDVAHKALKLYVGMVAELIAGNTICLRYPGGSASAENAPDPHRPSGAPRPPGNGPQPKTPQPA